MKKYFKKENLIFFLIVCICFFLRFVDLKNNPPGFYVDEAAIGYNAYSILQTGKDEYGKTLPLFFRSYGVYTMPGYIYSSVIPIKLFGLNEFSVRFLSALTGSLSVIIIYFLSKELFPDKDVLFNLIVSFVYATSPWSIYFSRGAFEANYAFFLLITGLWLQLLYIRTKKTFPLFLSIIFYLLSAYTYQTERFLAPLLFLIVMIFQIKKQLNLKLIVSLGIFFAGMIPQLLLVKTGAGQSRINSLSVKEESKIENVLSLYTAYFSPRNLFFNPDPDKQRSFPDLSVFYPWMIIPFLTGLYLFIIQKKSPGKNILTILLLLSPIPASVTRDPFSTLRSLPLMFPLIVIISMGIDKILKMFKVKAVWVCLIVIAFGLSITSLWRNLFILLPNERHTEWSYGFSQIAEEIKKGHYDEVLINDPLSNTYIELLFFLKYPPEKYQKEIPKIDLTNYYNLSQWSGTVSWDKYTVKPILWKTDIYKKQLIVAKPLDLSDSQAKEHFLSKAFVIIAKDGSVSYNGYTTNPELKIKDDERNKD